MKSLIDIHRENKETFKSKLIDPSDGRSFACKVWDVMTDGKENADNCLGENFNLLISTTIDGFFDNYEPSNNTKLDFYFTTYLLWLYLIVERIDFVFEVVNKDNKSKLFSDFKEKNFQTCQLIKKWANFIKHPELLNHFATGSTDRYYQFWKRRALSIELRTHKVYLQKLNYIHLNPVKAGLCRLPEDYKYSSASFYENGNDNWGFLSHYRE